MQVNSLAEKKLKGRDLEWLCTPIESTEVEAASAEKQKKGSQSTETPFDREVAVGRLSVLVGGPTSRQDTNGQHYFGLWVKFTYIVSL